MVAVDGVVTVAGVVVEVCVVAVVGVVWCSLV